MSLYRFTVNFQALAAKLGCNLPGTVVRMFCVDFINTVLDSDLLAAKAPPAGSKGLCS
jgi:hypothetical protein